MRHLTIATLFHIAYVNLHFRLAPNKVSQFSDFLIYVLSINELCKLFFVEVALLLLFQQIRIDDPSFYATAK